MKKVVKITLIEILATLLLALLIFLVVQATVESRAVDGPSMQPGLETGQRVLVVKAAYWFGDPQRGDIIIFQHPDDEERTLIKRIIGLPGDWVEVKTYGVFINGTLLDEPYTQGSNRPTQSLILVPEDSYFVMGDNRDSSTDSRRWGMLPRENIIGRAWLCYWPLSDWHLVR